MNISEMIIGEVYYAQNCGIVDEVICLGQPSEKEIFDRFGEIPNGFFIKVEYLDGNQDIWFEATGHLGSFIDVWQRQS